MDETVNNCMTTGKCETTQRERRRRMARVVKVRFRQTCENLVEESQSVKVACAVHRDTEDSHTIES